MKKNSITTWILIAVPAFLLTVFYGCSESQKPQTEHIAPINTSSTLVNYHPVLDRKMRGGDSMLVDFDALVQEELIVEADLPQLGSWVLQHGGMENPDSTLLNTTYRQLLNAVLVRDMSGGEKPCTGCTDSILIATYGYSTVIYLGKGRTSLQKMLAAAIQDVNDVAPQYKESPFNQNVELATWQEKIENLPLQIKGLDLVLFGNAVIFINRSGKEVSDYTFGQVLTVVDRVKEMDGYEDVRRLFERTLPQRTQQ